MKLTNKQEDVIKMFWKCGYFTADNLVKIYTVGESIADCLNKFIILGIVSQEIGTNKFKINREVFLRLQDEED